MTQSRLFTLAVLCLVILLLSLTLQGCGEETKEGEKKDDKKKGDKKEDKKEEGKSLLEEEEDQNASAEVAGGEVPAPVTVHAAAGERIAQKLQGLESPKSNKFLERVQSSKSIKSPSHTE